MKVELVTREDLEALKRELLDAIESFAKRHGTQDKEWLRTKEVRQMLGLSSGSLANWRTKGILKPSKIDGIYYYRLSEIKALLSAGAAS